MVPGQTVGPKSQRCRVIGTDDKPVWGRSSSPSWRRFHEKPSSYRRCCANVYGLQPMTRIANVRRAAVAWPRLVIPLARHRQFWVAAFEESGQFCARSSSIERRIFYRPAGEPG